MRASFNVSLAGFVSDVEAVVIAYENLIHQVNVFVPFDYFGSNTLDGPHALYLFEYDSQIIQKRFLLTSDTIRAKAECNEAASLLYKAANAFNPLTHPRFHMFWLENMAMLHELVGNIAESAEVRRRIFEVCKDVQYTRDNLWSPRPPILWKSRRVSASAESLKAKSTAFFVSAYNLLSPTHASASHISILKLVNSANIREGILKNMSKKTKLRVLADEVAKEAWLTRMLEGDRSRAVSMDAASSAEIQALTT
jgi:hypothetical protein